MADLYPDNQMVEIFGEPVLYPGVLPSTGKFSDGDFSNPLVKPSFIPAATMNLVLDLLAEMIKKMGGVPDNQSIMQLASLFTHTATANKAVVRDANGNARFAEPIAEDDAARLADILQLGNIIQDVNQRLAAPIKTRGGRNLMDVFEVDNVADLFQIIHQRCNNENEGADPDFSGLYVGDYVDLPSLTVSGTTYTQNLRLLLSGFNTFRNPLNKQNAKNMDNHILWTFQDIVLKKRMHSSDNNAGGYVATELRAFLEGGAGDGTGPFAVGLKEQIGDVLYTVRRYISTKGAMAWNNFTVFLPTTYEVGTTFYREPSNGAIYPDDEKPANELQLKWPIYEKFHPSKKYNNDYDWYWTSSPYAPAASSFCDVYSTGTIYNGNASNAAGGVAPAFCVR